MVTQHFGFWVWDGEHKPRPVSVAEYMEWAIANPHRALGQTEIADEILVSTVFIGISYSHGYGKPKLFETMVFGGKLDGRQERYATADEARAGHSDMVEKVRMTL